MRILLALLFLATVARADEYEAARLGRFARYVKEARQTDLTFLKGQRVPGVFVKRYNHTHYTDWAYERDHWHIVLRVPHPPDELTSGVPVTVPLRLLVKVEGDDPIAYSVRATASGVFAGRVHLTPSRVTKTRRGQPAKIEQGTIVFTPRLDWDADSLALEISFTDGAGTEFTVGRYVWWSNQLVEQHHLPRRRDLDPIKP